MRIQRNHVEHDNQVHFHAWFAYQYPKYINNFNSSLVGVNLGPRIGKIAKDKGVRKGWPDVQIAVPTNQYAGLFIEMKTLSGNVDAAQKAVHQALRDTGYHVAVCYSSVEAQDVTKQYLGGQGVVPWQNHSAS